MFEPPVSTPISRMTANAASRIIWYSLSVSVCAGATVIESPVCTPIGSKFSMEQTTTQLSIRSRITSISNNFQPDAQHRFFEQLSIFAFGDGLRVCADQFHAVSGKSAVSVQLHRCVERG